MSRTRYLKGPCSECGGHIEFPVDSIGLVADCPHCGKPTTLMLATPPSEPILPRRAIFWTLAAVLVLGSGLAGALVALKRLENWKATHATATRTSPLASTATPQAEPPPGPAELRVSEITLDTKPGSSVVYAVGTVKNNSDRMRYGVNVELDLFDAAGKKVGTAKDYQPSLERGAEWRFKALVLERTAVSAKLASLKEEP